MGALIRMRIEEGADLVVVRQRTRQLATRLGLDPVTTTRLCAALSELTWEALHAGGATLEVTLDEGTLEIHVAGTLSMSPATAARLLDDATRTAAGVVLRVPVPAEAPPADTLWTGLDDESPGSALEEIHLQNRELVTVLHDRDAREAELGRLAADLATVNAALRRTDAALRRSNADLERFASAAAHDLREPLAGISVFAGLIGMQRDDEQIRSHVRQIEALCTSMGEMLRGLMDYARLETIRDGPQRADATDIVGQALANLRGPIEAAAATVDVDALPELGVAPIHLLQVVQNLVGNALRYRRDEPPRIHVTCTRRGDGYALAVADNGRGIPADMQERVFGLFQRLARDADEPGTGVGLALVARIAERYGGAVTVDSKVGVGSTFTVTLPAP